MEEKQNTNNMIADLEQRPSKKLFLLNELRESAREFKIQKQQARKQKFCGEKLV